MSTINDGGPAFPMQDSQAIHAYAVASVSGITDPDERDRAYLKARADAVGGLTIRDYFAAKAMQAFIMGIDNTGGVVPVNDDLVSERAYEVADAMLKARQLDPQP